jgi:hypothetical protein
MFRGRPGSSAERHGVRLGIESGNFGEVEISRTEAGFIYALTRTSHA